MRTSALERPDAPLASALFSRRTTRFTPVDASANAMLVPMTPPPMTTTSAVSAIAAQARRLRSGGVAVERRLAVGAAEVHDAGRGLGTVLGRRDVDAHSADRVDRRRRGRRFGRDAGLGRAPMLDDLREDADGDLVRALRADVEPGGRLEPRETLDGHARLA